MTQEFYRGRLDKYFDNTYGDITKQDFLGEESMTTIEQEPSINEIPLMIESGLIDIQITSNRNEIDSSKM